MTNCRFPTTETDITLAVEQLEPLAEGILGLELRHPAGDDLPAWMPGAHVDLVLRDNLVRQYSLCGDPTDRKVYRIAVLREPESRGGSAYVHEQLATGDKVTVRGPRNHFSLREAPSYLFVAGGIGITPILPMIIRAESSGARWRLAYGGRRLDSMAFRAELSAYGDRVLLHPQDAFGLLDIPELLVDLDQEALVYCCGPEPLLAAMEECINPLRPGSLHVERFSPKHSEPPGRSDTFEVVLARSNLRLEVPPNRSILEVAVNAGVDVIYSCEEGICGSCETRVLSGRPDHRDSVLDEDERAANDVMMICVSRASDQTLELDL